MSYQKLLINRTSKFQTNLKSRNNSSKPYEDEIKKRLDKKMFSTYKIYDLHSGAIDTTKTLTRYVASGYWQDYYTAVYEPDVNPYPTPPQEP